MAYEYDDDVLNTFLDNQQQLFPEAQVVEKADGGGFNHRNLHSSNGRVSYRRFS